MLVCLFIYQFSSVTHSLRPHEFQHTRPPCPSPTPGVHSNSHPSSWWCHLANLDTDKLLLLIQPTLNFHSVLIRLSSVMCQVLWFRWEQYSEDVYTIMPSGYGQERLPGAPILAHLKGRVKWRQVIGSRSMTTHKLKNTHLQNHRSFGLLDVVFEVGIYGR